jgi:hypothetical protein
MVADPHEINMSNDLIYSIRCPYVLMLLSCMNILLLMLMQHATIFVTIQGLRKLPFIIWKLKSKWKLTNSTFTATAWQFYPIHNIALYYLNFFLFIILYWWQVKRYIDLVWVCYKDIIVDKNLGPYVYLWPDAVWCYCRCMCCTCSWSRQLVFSLSGW